MSRKPNEDLTGKRFGKLTVIKRVPMKGWECKCDCGNTTIAKSTVLKNGKRVSCGCIKRECKPKEDLTGKKFGKLTVIKYVPRKGWECKCDCGNTAYVLSSGFKGKGRVSCGCTHLNPKEDLTGKRFGKLTVIKYVTRKGWECKCDCGNITYRKSKVLISGDSKSCGCTIGIRKPNDGFDHNTHEYTRRKINGRYNDIRTKGYPRIDLTGKRFGKLTATKYIGDSKWECKCDCGNITECKSTHLRSGSTKSCGCIQRDVKTKDDLTGERFGKLTVIKYVTKKGWECKCDCGNITYARTTRLKKGRRISCGCAMNKK